MKLIHAYLSILRLFTLVLAMLLISTGAHAQRPMAPVQAHPVNLDLEEGEIGKMPDGWFIKTWPEHKEADYAVELLEEIPYSGRRCARIYQGKEKKAEEFGALMQTFDAAPYRGKAVRLRAAVRAEVSSASNHTQLWLRVDLKGGALGLLDQMRDRPIMSNVWHEYEVIGQIGENAEWINIGLRLVGKGQAWLDAVSFEILDEPLNDTWPIHYYQNTLKKQKEQGDKKGQAATLKAMGKLYIWHHDSLSPAKAIEYLQSSLILQKELDPKELDDQVAMGWTEIMLGAAYLYLLIDWSAMEHFQSAQMIFEKLDDKARVALVLGGIGSQYGRLGSHKQALDYLQSAIRIAEELGAPSLMAGVLSEIGKVYAWQGMYSQAVDFLQRAQKLFEDVQDLTSALSMASLLGYVYGRQGLYDKALGQLQTARAYAEQRGDQFVLADNFAYAAQVYSAQGLYSQAIEYWQAALRIVQQRHLYIFAGWILGKTASEYLSLKNYTQAVKTAHEALTLGQELKAQGVIWDSSYALAVGYEKLGQPRQALQYYELAIKTIETVRTRASSDEAKIHFLNDRMDVYEGLIAFLHQQMLNTPSVDLRRQAFDYAERAKARAFLDLLTESHVRVQKKIRPDLWEKERALIAKISYLQKTIAEQSGKKDAAARIKKMESELMTANQEHNDLKLAIRRENPEYAALRYPEPIPFEQAQALLDDKTALLHYVFGKERSLLLVTTRTRLDIYPLAARDVIDVRVQAFLKLWDHPPRPGSDLAYVDEAYRLYRLLLQPAETSLRGISALRIVPDGRLALLPFPALLTERSTRPGKIRWDVLPYLVKKYETALVPSASVLEQLQSRKKPAAGWPRELVVFADPIYEAEKKSFEPSITANLRGGEGVSLSEQIAGVYRSGLPLSRLPYSGVEAASIARLFGDRAVTHLREQATEERVKAEKLDQYRYVHFATHGIVHPDRPEFSAVVLGHERQEDGFLQLPEILNLELDAELVVLSACESGVGQQRRGEGLIGLARGFMYAGARSVLASLWKIEDGPATAGFMERFYRRLATERKVTALRTTQLELIREKKYSHPFYWAAFTLIGAP